MVIIGIILQNSPPQGANWIDFGDEEEEEVMLRPKDDAYDGQDGDDA